MVQFTVIFSNILFLSVLDLYTITQPDYIIISFQQKHATQYVDSCAAYINDYATSFITCHLPNNCACYYTTNNTECIAMNSSEFRNDAKNKHSRSPSVKLARDRNSHRMEDALNTKMKDCISYYGTHVASSPRAPLSRSQSRMLLPIRHANQMGLNLTTDRYRCVDNADCYGTQHDQYMTRMEASNNRSLTRPFGHFKSRVNSTSQVSFHTPIPQSAPFDHVGIYPSYTPSYGTVSASLLAFFAITNVYCITHMPSVFLWFVLLSHQMIVPAQAQTMNGSSFSCTGYQECLDIQCNDDQDCFVACAGDYACNTANIHAPSNANLFVECSSTRSCYTATIYGPSIGNLTVNCTIGRYTCYDVTIHGPTNGTLTVICEGAGDNGRLCEGIDIYCPIYGGCDVQCLEGDEYDCLRLLLDARSMINGALSLYSASGINKGTVWCPPNSGNDNECIISCETARACEDATVNTEPDSRLFITGKGSDTLKSTTIYCPSGNGICSINVSGDNYNMLSDLTIYAVNGLKNVSLSCNASNASYCYSVLNPISMGCTSDYGVRFHIALEPGSTDDWYGVDVNVTALCDDNTPISSGHYGSVFWCNSYHECSNIFCNDDQDCFISCGFLYTGDWGCETANIKAPSNANLVVECVSSYACSTASIYGPSIGNLIVNCIPFDNGGVDACKDLTVYGPTNGNLTVICEGRGGIYNWHVCDGIYIYCPVYGECDVQCPDGHQNDCIQLVLDARNTIDGTLSLHSVPGIAASTVWCPGNDNECIISCESGGCQSATIKTEADSKLFITAEGTNTLKNTSIYCPEGDIEYINGKCSITVASDTYGALSNTYIYAVNGFNNLSLTCNYSSNVTNCYDESLRPRLFCLPDFSVSCDLTLQSEFDVWECQSGSHALMCDWSHSPTSATTSPSSAPTTPPSDLTSVPSSAPSSLPSNSPTDATEPTIDPTYQPTGSSTDPTSFPTTSPILYPNCNYKKKYAKTFTGVGKTWTKWYDGKVKLGRNAFLDEYPWCGDASSLEFFHQFVYDESARTLTFYAQVCCGTDKRFGSAYQVSWVPNGFGSKTEYVPNQAWIDHNTPLYDYTCKYKKNYEITFADTAWATWQQYCDKWIKKGRDAFLNEFAFCGYEDSLEFFYRFKYNSNAKQLTFYGHFCCGKESGKSLQFGAAYSKSGKIPNQAWYDHNPWAYEQECIDQTDWA